MSLTTTFSRMALCAVLIGGGAVACGGDDDGGGSSSAFCDTIKELDEFEFDLEADDSAAQEEEFQALLDEAVEAAPSEIEDDLAVVTAEDPDPESEEFKEAEARVERYIEDECGIVPDDSEE